MRGHKATVAIAATLVAAAIRQVGEYPEDPAGLLMTANLLWGIPSRNYKILV